MKTTTKLIWAAAGAAALAATPLLAKPHGPRGTDVLHYSAQATFQNPGVEPNATGSVKANQNDQGNANNQRLDISLKGLTAGDTYSLYALTGGSSSPVLVDSITTDGKGNATIHYQSNSNGKGNGKGKAALPDAINPITSINELDVVDTNSNTVLTADFGATNRFQYMVKRDISDTNGVVTAELRLKDVNGNAQVSVMASGLAGSTDYSLAINGNVVQTGTSDVNGRLNISATQTGVGVADIQSVSLLDSANNVVVGTTLP